MRLSIYKLILYFFGLLKNIKKKLGQTPGYTRSLELWSDPADHPGLTGSIAISGLCDLRSDQGRLDQAYIRNII